MAYDTYWSRADYDYAIHKLQAENKELVDRLTNTDTTSDFLNKMVDDLMFDNAALRAKLADKSTSWKDLFDRFVVATTLMSGVLATYLAFFYTLISTNCH